MHRQNRYYSLLAVCVAWGLAGVTAPMSEAGHAHEFESSKHRGKSERHNSLAAMSGGSGDSHRKRLLILPEQIQQANVSVAMQPLNQAQTLDVFDIDLLRHGVQPILVQIHNTSDQTYRFAKHAIDAHYIPAAQAARYACPNPVVTGLRVIWWLVSFFPVWVLSDFDEAKQHRPVFSRDIQRDYASEEISDGTIAPNGSLSGFVFVRPLPTGSHVTLTLINATTQQPLIFETAVQPTTAGL